MYKAGYAKYLLSNEDDIQWLAKKKLGEWIQWEEVCIMEDVQKRRDGGKNMPTVGEVFGFSIIPSNRETNHFAQDSQ